jgi:hypothetical protein
VAKAKGKDKDDRLQEVLDLVVRDLNESGRCALAGHRITSPSTLAPGCWVDGAHYFNDLKAAAAYCLKWHGPFPVCMFCDGCHTDFTVDTRAKDNPYPLHVKHCPFCGSESIYER